MTRLKTIVCYVWALTAVPLILATFMGMNFWAEKLVAYTGLKVSPWCTGGELTFTGKNKQHKTLINRPVFDGLIGQIGSEVQRRVDRAGQVCQFIKGGLPRCPDQIKEIIPTIQLCQSTIIARAAIRKN